MGACMHAHAHLGPNRPEVSDPLVLELQAEVCHSIQMLGIVLWSSARIMRALHCLGHVSSPDRNILELRLFYGQVGWLILQEGTKTFERNSSSKKREPMTGLLKHMILRSHFLLYLVSFSVVFSVSFHSTSVLVVFLISGKPLRGRSVVVTHSLNGYSLSWWGRHSSWLQSNDV